MTKQNYSVINNVFFLIRDIYREKKLLLALLVVEGLCGGAMPLFGIYLPKLAVDMVTEGVSTDRAISTLGLFTAAMVAVYAAKSMAGGAKYMQYNSMRQFYLKKMFLKSIECDYRQIESADGQTRYVRATNGVMRGDGSGTSRMVVSMLAIFTSTLSFLLYSGMLSMLNPLILTYLALLTGMNYISLNYARKYEEKQRGAVSAIEKKLRYIETKSEDITAGKDIRIYGMTGWFVSLRDNLLSSYTAIEKQIRNRHYISALVDAFTLLLRDGAAYIYLIYMVTGGKITVGDFMLYFGAITGFSGFITSIVNSVNNINTANTEMNYMRAFLECADSPEPENPVSVPASGAPLSISFRNVCFSYGGSTDNVLDNFNLNIKPREKVALVGVNGAGKTTIVKLLCGFYTPDSGEILINGINIKNFRKKELFGLFSSVFQDISIMPFTIAENISMKPDNRTDKGLVSMCLEKAGLYEDVLKYKDGIDSNMEKIHPGGVVLSGGQQQKLLMARALYKNTPLLILDEPTAALDPFAESETYEKFHELSSDKTVIYISHRLASTRFCDNIILLKDGAAAESGTHGELMRKGGEYAKMFEIQSHYYTNQREAAAYV